MHILKQSTAASVLVGPVLDSTGAAYTGAAIGDFNLTKNGTSAAMASAATATHDHNGHYVIAMTTGNTDTLGRATITCNKATYAMALRAFEVLTATTFDAIVTNAAGGANGLPLSLASNKVNAVVAASDVTGNVAADIQTIKTQGVTCAAGVTVLPNVGNSTHALVVDATGGVNAGSIGGQTATAAGAVTVGAFVGNATAALAVDGSGRVDLGKILGTASAGAVGKVALDMAQLAPTTNTAHSVGDCLNAARAQGFGKWVLSGTTLTLYASDGTTVVRTFTLDSATVPTTRT